MARAFGLRFVGERPNLRTGPKTRATVEEGQQKSFADAALDKGETYSPGVTAPPKIPPRWPVIAMTITVSNPSVR